MTTTNPNITAAVWMIGAIISFTSMAVAGRMVSDVHDTFEIMLFRSIIGFGLVVAIAHNRLGWGFVKTNRLGLHATRNLFHFAGQNLWFFALPLIPLAQLFALEFTSPLWVMVLAPLVLGERITVQKLVVAGLGVLGVLCVVQPNFETIGIGVIAAGAAAIGFAMTALATRSLTGTDHIATIMFYLTGFQLIFGAIGVCFALPLTLPTSATCVWLILIGVAGLTAHYSMTQALKLAPASVVMPIDFARLPLVALIGVLFYDETLTIGVLVGAVMILGANYINIRIKGE